MQIFGLHKNIYKLARYACTQELLDKDVKERKKVLGDWELLKAKKVPDNDIERVTGISRATYYRRKKALKQYGIAGLKVRSKRPRSVRKSKVPESCINTILDIRFKNPTYGKAKITVILKRDYGLTISESTVGRILKSLIAKGKIRRSISAVRTKRKRRFKAHAKPWQYGKKARHPGELVQIDHMSVIKNNLAMKHFQAWDPITKVIIADVTSNATSSAARKFLRKVIKEAPFILKSIQVDGGSEFMKDFEHECQKLTIPLYVLPPNRPQYNGGVERGKLHPIV